MKVVIQQPRDLSGSFVNSVFEAELAPHPLPGWHTLRGLRPAPEAEQAGLPVLHKGFFDAHLHMAWMGLFEVDLDLRESRSVDEALDQVRQRLRGGAPFVRAYGWDESRWGRSLGSLNDLRLPEEKPVILYRVCGHSALVNRNLRARAGRADLPALVTDRALPEVSAHVPAPDQAACEQAFLKAQARVLAAGISAVGDMSLDETSATAVRALAESDRLRIDVAGVIEAGRTPSVESAGPCYARTRSVEAPLDRPASFRIQHWKRYLDGSLGSRTAWLTRPYEDGETFGDSLRDTKELVEQAREALREGFYLSFHAIGDAALDQVLEVGERLGPYLVSRRFAPVPAPFAPTRHRIEHAQVVRDDQIKRLHEQGHWMVCAQPHHRVADQGFARARLGDARLRGEAYRAGALWRAGVPLALSSDGPVDTVDPRAVIEACLTHENPAERLGFYEAMWRYTTGSRLDAGLEAGRLGPGSSVFLTPVF